MNTTRKIDLAPHVWHEDLDAAVDEARRLRRPILSLRLLGRLDEELSCANSRFFRTMLYPDPRVSRVLSTQFVLHWRSVRPVPVVTIDFGDGRSLVRTLTGNSAHLVLDGRGRPVDALPGMYGAQGFLDALSWARALAVDTAALEGAPRHRALARAHTLRARTLRARTLANTLANSLANTLAAPRLQPPSFAPEVQHAIARKRPDARDAGQLAIGKMLVERPLLDRIDDLATTVQRDEDFNERALHPLVHERFVHEVDDEASLTDWLYADVFQMPPDDPWLGLVTGFAALDHDGRSSAVAAEASVARDIRPLGT